MAYPAESSRLGNFRFNLLAKNIASGIGVLLTPGLIFLVVLGTLHNLYTQVLQGETLQISWTKIIPTLLLVLITGTLVSHKLIKFISHSITDTAASVSSSAQNIASGNFTVKAYSTTNDELSDLAETMNTTRESLRELMQKTSEVYDQAEKEELGLSESVANMTCSADSIFSQINVVEPKAQQLEQVSQQLVSAAQKIAHAREQIARYTSEVLTLGQTDITEISQIAKEISQLNTQSIEISNAVKQIADIAEQTNLLALNATIESAKAGKIGSGFAVVAGQIKELAVQTGQSAGAVTNASIEIQTHCNTTVEVTADMTQKLEQINSAQEESMTAVAQQREITNSMTNLCNLIFECVCGITTEIEKIRSAYTQTNQHLTSICSNETKVQEWIADARQKINELRLTQSQSDGFPDGDTERT